MIIGDDTITHTFDSPKDYLLFMKRNRVVKYNKQAGNWSGNLTFDEAAEKVITGDADMAKKSAEVFDSVIKKKIVGISPQWELSVGGSFPCVPAALAGHPHDMYRQTPRVSNSSPVRIFVSVSVGAFVTSEQIENRGAHIAALAMTLSAHRAVEVFVFSDFSVLDAPGMGLIPNIRIPVENLDLATFSFMVCSPAVERRLMFSYPSVCGCKFDGKYSGIGFAWGGKPKGASDRFGKAFHRKIKDAIGCSDGDLYMPLIDNEDLSVENPERWLDEQIAKYTQANEVDE